MPPVQMAFKVLVLTKSHRGIATPREAFWDLVLTKSLGGILYRMQPNGRHFGNIQGFVTGSTGELCKN